MKTFNAVLAGASVSILLVAMLATAPPMQMKQGVWIDRGGTIATGGTSQTAIAANPNRTRVLIENPCSTTSQGIGATENLFINFEGVASSTSNGKSVELQPCGSYDSGVSASPGTVTINAATTGHQYLAKEQQ